MSEEHWNVKRVRQQFIDFFISKEHLFVPSSPVVPHDDPTLLFANSGMNQFKPIFLGTLEANSPMLTWKRAANSQKCIRAGGKHNDLDDVGKDSYHHTFFEMLGNWSFGDYFKQEAIDWAWELLTKVYKLDPTRLYATYFAGDQTTKPILEPDLESKNLWLRYLPENRVLPFGMKENFWEMGDQGPCGPCTEIHYDRLGGREVPELVNRDDPTLIEIWNLVFMQFLRESDRSLSSLPNKHVDTGMGLERLTSVLQNKMANYDTDIFLPLFSEIEKLSKVRPYSGKYGVDDPEKIDMAYRVVADHIRTLTFAVCDGAFPAAEGRNYVLRRITRRAIRYGREILKADKGFFHKLVPSVIHLMKDFFPELSQTGDRVQDVIKAEEELFNRTFEKGLLKLHRMTVKLQAKQSKVLSGSYAFKLYGTYGFPFDLTERILEEKYQMSVDSREFYKYLEEEKERSRKKKLEATTLIPLTIHARDQLSTAEHIPPTDDEPKYETSFTRKTSAKILRIWDGKEFLDSITPTKNSIFGLILDKTNFYAEGGGQSYDTGLIETSNGLIMNVQDVQLYGLYILHAGSVSSNNNEKLSIKTGESVELLVDSERRAPIMANHTSTHLINFALRETLSTGVEQKGSLVIPERFRFDFSASKPLTLAQVAQVDSIVNGIITQNLPVFSKPVSKDAAFTINGVRAVFGEKYPDPVRVVSVGVPIEELLADPQNPKWLKYSIEFCGGTHLGSTQDAKLFAVLSEEPLATGIRRIIAVTGKEAYEAQSNDLLLEKKVNEAQKLSNDELVTEVPKLVTQVDAAHMTLKKKLELREKIDVLQNKLKEKGKSEKGEQKLIAQEYAEKFVKEHSNSTLKFHVDVVPVGGNNVALGDAIKIIQTTFKDLPIALLSADKEKNAVTVVSNVPKSHHPKLQANDWAKEVAGLLGGKGGGKPDTAQGSGKDASRLEEAVNFAKSYASSRLP